MVSGGVWALQDEEEWEFEDEVQRLERRLEKAVKKEDYERAAKARDKLYRYALGRGGGGVGGGLAASYSSSTCLLAKVYQVLC